ncbi:MAG: putative Na+/H+ antiporter [Planctomycetota bacterium]
MLHFLGEVEAIFGIWAVVLAVALTWSKGRAVTTHYLAETVNYTEPMFVVIVMAIASTRPVLDLASACLRALAGLSGTHRLRRGGRRSSRSRRSGLADHRASAAMTIACVLLGRKFYELGPSRRLKYATLGLLFVNVSVGSTLAHFAAPRSSWWPRRGAGTSASYSASAGRP